MNDANSSEQPVSLTEVLNSSGIALTAVAANKVLYSSGMTEVRWRPSSKADRPPKSYRAASPLGEQHGAVNEVNAVGSGDPTLLKYTSSQFAALWAHPEVQATLAALLREGEVKYRDGAAKGASEAF